MPAKNKSSRDGPFHSMVLRCLWSLRLCAPPSMEVESRERCASRGREGGGDCEGLAVKCNARNLWERFYRSIYFEFAMFRLA